MDAKAEKLALFRYGLIAPLVLEPLPRGQLTRRAEELAARQYDIPDSQRISVSVDTLLEWSLRYRRGGFEALAPKPRQDRGQSRAITPQLAALIERLKRENPHRTGATLLRELALTSGQNDPGVSASTLYRFLKQHGLTERQLLEPAAHKKFEAQFSNQIWQADMLFGPYVQRPGGGKMQVFLHAILDDASRLIPHAQFYPNQGLDACLDCLRHAIAARGVPVRLYIDNAKIYRSQQLARIAASLGISIVHTPPYQPEGRGKIERYFRTVRDQFLTNLDPKLSLSQDQLNDRYGTWLENVYHRSEHSALNSTPCCAGSAISNKSGNSRLPPISAASSSIASIAGCAAIALFCCTTSITKPLLNSAAKPSRCVSILSTPPKSSFIFRASYTARRASSIPSATPACLP